MFDILSTPNADERAAEPEEWPESRIDEQVREYERAKATVVPVSDLMDTPAGRDEAGTPSEHIGRCDDCGSLYRKRPGSWHRCSDGQRRYYAEGDE